jgi:flagellar biosynthetic protein FliP
VSTFFGITLALAFVLLVMGFAMRFLRRFASGTMGSRGRIRMEVVQRVSLGPKQGIALVRVGEQVIAVSMGDGGVRPILELTGEDREALLAIPATEPIAIPPFARSFQAALRTAGQTAARSVGRTAAVLALLAIPALAQGQAVPAQRPPAVAQQPAGAGQGGAPVAAAAAQQPTDPGAAAAARNAELIDRSIARVAPTVDVKVGDPAGGGLRLSGTVGVVIMMGLLTLLPTLVLMMTGFTRILIVLGFLRQALGTQNAPPAQLMAGLALLLTGFVMAPTLSEVNRTAITPWMNGQMEQGEMMKVGVKPFRHFMQAQTRPSDLNTFMSLSRTPPVASVEDVPLVVLMSAFVTSELKTAFQIGFALFLPFIIIDVVVSSVLMSMGMMMLPPAMIALPFKLLLFVLVDGWSLVVQGLVQSFH